MSSYRIILYIKYFFIPVFLFIHLEADLYPAENVLETEHFKVFHERELLGRAINVSSELEMINKRVAKFFEYDPLKKTEVYLTEEKISFNGDYAVEDFYMDPLLILSGHDYKSISEFFERKVFFIYYYSLCKGKENLPEIFNAALYVYYKSTPVFLNTISKDVTAICSDGNFDVGVVSRFDTDIRKSIYTVFIDFIFSNYGRRIFLQLLKDSICHEGIINLLSEISGDTHNQINDKFRKYIREKTGSVTESFSGYEIASEDAVPQDDTLLVDCGNDFMVLLKRCDDGFYLSVSRRGTFSRLKIDHFNNNYYFTGLIILDDDSFAVSALTGSGSVILFYSISDNRLKFFKQFPGLSVTGISRNSDNKLIITANCYDEAFIFTYDQYVNFLDMLYSGQNMISSASIGDSIFFISQDVRSEVKVLDRASGKVTSVLNSPGVIGSLYVYNSKIIFSVYNEGITDILTFDPVTNKIEKKFSAKILFTSPYIYKDKIYFLSLVKNRIRLVSVNQVDLF